MRKIALVVVLLFAVALSFGQDFSFSLSLNGNAHIVSWETMSRFHEMKKDGRLPHIARLANIGQQVGCAPCKKS